MATDVLELETETPQIEITDELRAEVLDRIIVARVGLYYVTHFLVIWLQGLLLKKQVIGVRLRPQMVDICFIVFRSLLRCLTKK